MKKLILILGVALILSNCDKKSTETFCNNLPLETSTINNEIEYQIVNTIIETYHQTESNIVVNQKISSVSQDHLETIKDFLEYQNIPYDEGMLLNYLEKNQTSNYFDENIMQSPVYLISEQEINCIFNEDETGWKRFYQKYPQSHGFLNFCRPGVNSNEDHAIIEYSSMQDYLAAAWFIVILEKQNGEWTVTQRITTIVA